MDNPYVTIIGHPTGRIISRRNPYEVDLEKIFEKAKERDIALELDCFPDRLDLRDMDVKAAISRKVKISIDTDSHLAEQLRFMELGVATARRGWATKNDVINTLELRKLEKLLRR